MMSAGRQYDAGTHPRCAHTPFREEADALRFYSRPCGGSRAAPAQCLVLGAGASCQNSGSAATHSGAGMLQYGRMAKTFAPSCRASALARRRVLARRKTYSVESATCHTDPSAGRRLRVTVTTANRAPATDHARPRLSSGRKTPKPWTGVPTRAAFLFATQIGRAHV